MQTKWNIGGCGTDCGSSGVTIDCPCTPPCAAGTARNQYDLSWHVPGGGPYGSGFIGSARVTYVRSGGGCCVYEDAGTHDVCGIDCYAQFLLCGASATILLRSLADDSVRASFVLDSLLGTDDCAQDYTLRPGIENIVAFCGNVPLATASASPVGTAEPPCTETPYVIPPGSGNCCPCPSGEPCGVFAERWDRADSTDLGDDWEEIAGDWEITSHRATIGSAHAIAKPNGMYVAYSAKMVEAVCTGAEGDRIRLMPAYDDADNYKFAEWEVGSGGFLRVGVRSGGSDTIVHTTYVDTVPGQYYRFRACGTAWLTAQLTGSGVDRYSSGNVTGPGTMTVVAIGTGSAATDVRFADVHVWRATSEDCVECLGFVPDCSTNCCPDDLLPITAYVTIGAGWTDADCTRCNEVAATYALDHISSPHGTWFYACNGGLWACCWGFEEAWCQSTAFGVYQYRLHVSAAILPAATPGRCFYRVNVVLGYQAGGGGPTSVLGAYYDGPEFDGTDSCRGQFTVTKVAETFTGSAPRPCNGTLPTTLLLEIP